MTRWALLLLSLVLVVSVSAFGQIIDPVGFCPPPPTATACSTATGFTGETVSVGTTSFGMFKTGGGTGLSNVPWFLLLAVPEMVAGTASAPTITSDGGVFSQSAAVDDEGAFSQTQAGSIYAFADGLTGDASMRGSNMFCDGASIPCASSNEISAFGKLPKFFEIFVYTFTPAFDSGVGYSFTTSAMVGGTYLAAAGGSNPFSTPFTTTGLVNGPGGGGGGGGGKVPEPSTMVLLGSGLLFTCIKLRKKMARS